MTSPDPSGLAAFLNGIPFLVLSFASFYCTCNEGIVRKRPHGSIYITSVIILLATNCADLIIVCLRDLSRGDKENTALPLIALICFCLLSLTKGGTQNRLTWTVVVIHHLIQAAAQGTSSDLRVLHIIRLCCLSTIIFAPNNHHKTGPHEDSHFGESFRILKIWSQRIWSLTTSFDRLEISLYLSILCAYSFYLPFMRHRNHLKQASFQSEIIYLEMLRMTQFIVGQCVILADSRLRTKLHALIQIAVLRYQVTYHPIFYGVNEEKADFESRSSAQKIVELLSTYANFISGGFLPALASISNELYFSKPLVALMLTIVLCSHLLRSYFFPQSSPDYKALSDLRAKHTGRVTRILQYWVEILLSYRLEDEVEHRYQEILNLKEREDEIHLMQAKNQFFAHFWGLAISFLIGNITRLLPQSPENTSVMASLFLFNTTVCANLRSFVGNIKKSVSDLKEVTDRLARPQKPWRYDRPGAADLEIKQCGDIQILGVSFQHKNNHEVFHNLNLRIPLGKTTAIAGPNGVGKTTLAMFITGLLEPSTGTIQILGHDIQHITTRRSGRTEMENLSILDWIKFPRRDARNEDVLELAKSVDLLKEVDKYPEGFNKEMKAKNISSGNMERISYVQAFATGRQILIVDEFAAHIDSIGRKRLFEALKTYRSKHTNIIIMYSSPSLENANPRLRDRSQNLTMAQDADYIVYIHDKDTIEQGTPREFMQKNGYYSKAIRSEPARKEM